MNFLNIILIGVDSVTEEIYQYEYSTHIETEWGIIDRDQSAPESKPHQFFLVNIYPRSRQNRPRKYF